jgi:hypothetical protein
VRGDCSFCWYWWNCWPWLFKISFHNSGTCDFFVDDIAEILLKVALNTRNQSINLFQLFSQGTSGTEIVFVHYCYFIVRTKENNRFLLLYLQDWSCLLYYIVNWSPWTVGHAWIHFFEIMTGNKAIKNIYTA